MHSVTAREMCEAFWDVQYRLEWEITVDQAPTVVEVCGDDTVLLYQVCFRLAVFVNSSLLNFIKYT